MASASVVSRKLRVSHRSFLSLSIILGAFLVLVRLYDMVIVANISGYPPGSWLSQFYGFGYDLLFFLRVLLWMIIPLVAIGYYSRISQKIVFTIIGTLIILSELVLIQYFAVARVPLGADVLAYSKSEILQTINASGQMSLSKILAFVIFAFVVPSAFLFINTITVSNGVKRTITTSIILTVFLGSYANPYSEDYNNEFQMFVASNKLSFFNNSIENYRRNKAALEDNLDEPFAFSEGENAFEYIDANYPLLHIENTPDVLGSYFNSTAKRPSIVFIVVESLGRAYSGENAYLGSFTPYLDSLMQKSLYWENNLSTSGRTFQVLPALLGSLPFGEHGFSDLGDQMPDHLSMISLLKKQAGYHSAFYYGGEAPFDNMEAFMKRQGIDKVVDQKDFGPSYARLPAKGNGFSWGYGDKEIFKKYMDDLNPEDSMPRIDVMLTLAMHDPFRLPNQEQYNQRVKKRIEALGLDSKQKTFNKNYIPQFASILYFDDALRGFITNYSKRKDFENTIFVITGDHRMPEIPINTQIDRFHVPLVIYSPMLKKAEKFSSIVSHFDVTPSLLAFLQHNYGIRQPTVSAWIGHGLDTETSFRSIQAYPMMRNNNEFMDFINGQDFLSGETLYRITENLQSEPVKNYSVVKEDLQLEFENFRKANLYVTRNNRLIPDSIKIQ